MTLPAVAAFFAVYGRFKKKDESDTEAKRVRGAVYAATGKLLAVWSNRKTVPKKGGKGTTEVTVARISADVGTNRIIVSAPVDQMAEIEALIRQLDDASKVSIATRILRLSVADARQLSKPHLKE